MVKEFSQSRRPACLVEFFIRRHVCRMRFMTSSITAVACGPVGGSDLFAHGLRHRRSGAVHSRLGGPTSAAPGPRASSPYLVPLGNGIAELVLFLVILLFSWIMSRIEHHSVGEYGLPLKKGAFIKIFSRIRTLGISAPGRAAGHHAIAGRFLFRKPEPAWKRHY